MSKSRAGRKSWSTRVRYQRAVGAAVVDIANLTFKYSNAVTDEMQIERSWNGQSEIISFGKAYSELEGWSGKTFFNTSELGFSDFLAELFQQGSRIFTLKAVYRLVRKSKQMTGADFQRTCD